MSPTNGSNEPQVNQTVVQILLFQTATERQRPTSNGNAMWAAVLAAGKHTR